MVGIPVDCSSLMEPQMLAFMDYHEKSFSLCLSEIIALPVSPKKEALTAIICDVFEPFLYRTSALIRKTPSLGGDKGALAEMRAMEFVMTKAKSQWP